MVPPKIKVVNKNIGSDNVPEFARQFAFQLAQGRFDTHLDLLYIALDDRVRNYMRVSKPIDEDTQKKLAHIRKLRGVELELVIGTKYGVFGDIYRGVVVAFHGEGKPYDNGARKARVEVVISTPESKLEVGTFRLIPMAALMELPPETSQEPSTTQIQKI